MSEWSSPEKKGGAWFTNVSPDRRGPFVEADAQAATERFGEEGSWEKGGGRKSDAAVVDERYGWLRTVLVAVEHVVVVVGPVLFVSRALGGDPGLALVCSGCATLGFSLLVRGRVPAYQGASLGGLLALGVLRQYGRGEVLYGLLAWAVVYLLMSAVVWALGPNRLRRLLPADVTGPWIVIVGLLVAWSGGLTLSAGRSAVPWLVGLGVMGLAAAARRGRGVGLFSVLLGIAVGWILAWAAGDASFGSVGQAAFIRIPKLAHLPERWPLANWSELALTALWASVAAAVDVGRLLALGEACGDAGLLFERSRKAESAGDRFGLSTHETGRKGVMLLSASFAASALLSAVVGLVGGLPLGVSAESAGVIAATEARSRAAVMTAAVLVIALGVFGKGLVAIESVPPAVLGAALLWVGVMVAAGGVRLMVRDGVNGVTRRHMVVTGAVVAVGVAGMAVGGGEVSIPAVVAAGGAAGLLGMVVRVIERAGWEGFVEERLEQQQPKSLP